MTDNLLPCPFCKSPARYEEDGDHHGDFFNFGCSKEDCILHLAFYTEAIEGKQAAIIKWNTRTPPDSVTIKREVVEKIIAEMGLRISVMKKFGTTRHDEGTIYGYREALALLDDALKGKA